MAKKKQDSVEDLKEFAAAHPALLLIGANPVTDEILCFFGDKCTFVRFPKSEDITNGYVFQLLHSSKLFGTAANQFLSALTKGMEIDESHQATNQVLNVVGGSMQAINKEITKKKK